MMGYAEGLALGAQAGEGYVKTFNDAYDAPVRRQSALEQLQAQRQANALNAINLQKQQMNYQDLLGARRAAQNEHGTPAQTTTTVTPPAPSSVDALGSIPGPIPSSLQGMLPSGPDAQRQTSLQSQLGAVRTQAYDPSKSIGDNDLPPGVSTIPQAQYDAQTAQIADLKAQQAGITPQAPALDDSSLKSQPSPASPLVQAYHDGRVQSTTTPEVPPDKAKAVRDYWLSIGNTSEAAKAGVEQKQIIDIDALIAKQKAQVAIGGGDLTKFEQMKQQLDISKEMLSTITPLATRPATRQIAQQLLDGYKKTFPGDQILQGVTLDQFSMTPQGAAVAVPDQNGNVIGHYVLDPASGNMKFEKSSMGEFAHNVQEIPAPDGKTAQKFQYNPQTQKYDQPLGAPYVVKSQVPSVNVHVPMPVLRPIPGAFDPTTGAPMLYNNRTGEVTAATVQGGVNVAGAKADFGAQSKALAANEGRLAALTGFTNRIDSTLPIIERAAKQYGSDLGPMLNNYRSGYLARVGSPQAVADMKALDLGLVAVRGELAKVESGSLGMSGANVSSANEMRDTLDKNLDYQTLIALSPKIRELSNTAKQSVSDVSDGIRKKLPGNQVTAPPQPVLQYFNQNAGKFDQGAMVQQLRAAGWSDKEIGAAWSTYKRGGK